MNTEVVDDDVCELTGKAHVPDWGSLSILPDGDEVYLDINCKDCGRSGCIGEITRLAKEIQW